MDEKIYKERIHIMIDSISNLKHLNRIYNFILMYFQRK